MSNRDSEGTRKSLFDILIRRDQEGGKITQGFSDLLYDMKEHRARYWGMIMLAPLTGIMVSGWFCQYMRVVFQKQSKIRLLQCFTAWLSTGGMIIAAVIAFAMLVLMYRFYKITNKDYYVDRENNVLVSKRGVHGTAHWQTEKERKKCFNRSKHIEDLTGDILGVDDEGRLYTLRDDLVGINRNKCVFGTPGSGKSAAIIENDIIQCMRREESAIITDSKGDLYRKLSQLARDNGYCVKVLNLKSNELKNSDAFHLLKYLENGDTSVAEMLANCIIENTGSGHMDYWEKNELNGYKALLLYISTNEALKKAGRNTLAEMYNMCTQNTPQQLETIFSSLPKSHPARQAYNIYANCKPDVQGQILNGMGIKLSFLIDYNAQQIVSHDEIDLIAPMKKKCMYFVVIPDTNKTYNVIANLFFNMMLIKQCEYSDSLTDRQRDKQVFVNYILDEFKATGAINNFDGTITTVRSRKIGITTVLQTLGQLQDMYPGKAYDTILGAMTVKILLRAGDETTSRYFNMIGGKQTRLNKSSRYSDTIAETVHMHNSETISEGLIGADLITIDSTQKMDANKLIVCILGFEPVKLNKYLSFKNPYLQEWEEKIPGRHKPLWRKKQEDAEKKRRGSLNKAVKKTSSEKVRAFDTGFCEEAGSYVREDGYDEPFDPDTGEILSDAVGFADEYSEGVEIPKKAPSAKKKGRYRKLTEEELGAYESVIKKFD